MTKIKLLLMLPFTLLSYLFGHLDWTAPPWLVSLNRFRNINPAKFWGGLAGLVILSAGYLYYQSLPKSITVTAEIRQLEITPNSEAAKPDTLDIRFEYDLSNLKSGQLAPHGVPSVARIDLVGETINQGIKLTPAKKGHWSWLDDRSLRFVPESDWSAGVEYSVEFDANIFVNEARLSDYSYTFTSPEFSVDMASMTFYQDPQDISIRRAISTLQFSHPVDKTSLEKQLSMSMRPSDSKIEHPGKNYSYKITYDKNLREAYVQSEPVSLPEQSNYMKLLLDKGVTTILGGEASIEAIEEKLLIPDLYSFLKVKLANTQIIRNEKNDPEQVLMLEFTDEIDQQELLNKLEIYLLPKRNQYWKSPREVSQKVLSKSKKHDLNMIANERDVSKVYNFVLDVPENRFVYIRIASKLTSVNRFVHASFYDTVVRAPQYPKEVDIAGEGSLLTYSGNHQLSILSRGIPQLKYSIGRLLDGQINHLISQTQGDINNPSFSAWSFKPENITELSHKEIDIVGVHPKQANYSSLDLTQLLPQDKNRFGLFFVNVEGWGNKTKRRIYGADDKRMILITDLGLIVKNNADKSHNVFVQSLKTGLPVAGANVQLLGKNGIPLYSRTTSQKGHVEFPSTRDYKKEKQPTVFVVKTTNDISFIPYDRYSRQINLSKYDIGGVRVNHSRKQQLNAYLFSDRGIYRPGEKINIGAIIKNHDFTNAQGIPLEMVVRGPRNNELKVTKLTLAELGFFDFQYQTGVTSDTGRYRASLHLVRNNRHRGREIGSINFKVEEFQPDILKIESKLLSVNNQGWSVQTTIKAKVSLQNLFGIPAAENNINGRLIIQPINFKFKQYKDYRFTDPFFDRDNTGLNLNRQLPTQKTNADGQADFELDLHQFSQGSYSLRFVAEGYVKGGGRSVVATNTAMISPLKELVGFKADGKLDYIAADSKRSIEFIAVDNDLTQLNKKDLTFHLLQIQNVSTLVKQYDNTYQYQSVKKENEISHSQFEIAKQGNHYKIDSTQPGDYAIEIRDGQSRRLSRVNYSVVGFGNMAGKIDKNAELQVRLSKTDYLPGELIEMNIKAPYTGAGLITIETDKVHHFKWFKSENLSSIQSIRLPNSLEGTGYINVTFVRDFGSKEIFASPLSYAVQPFSIDRSKRKIDVTIEMKEIVRPGKSMAIDYKASRTSKIVLFAIDEGILQVAKYSTPDPLKHFLKKKALAVETMQIMDLILPEFELLKTLSASGGGARERRALAKNLNPFTRKTDKPAVFWSGILTARTEKQTVKFDVPNTFAGSLRVMAVAVAEDAVGSARKSTLVRGPFVLSPNVLTQVAPDDEFAVTVGIANIIEGSGKNALVDISVGASDHLTLIGDTSVQLNIDENSEGQFRFKVKANNKLGAAELTFTARHKNEESTRTTSLSVRPAMPFFSTFTSGFEKDGSVEIDLERKLYANLANQSISASISPLVLVDGLTAYLEAFPHGCTEQVVSKVFPIVGLMSHPAYAPHVKKVDESFSQVIKKLRERQLGDGSFSFWPGSRSTAEYPSIYVMHFLIEAQSLGYPVPSDMIQRGQYYLQDYVGQAARTLAEARNRANAIYLLSRLGSVTTNYLIDLEEYLDKNYEKRWRKDILATYMAATYRLLQKDSEAFQLIAEYELGAKDNLDIDNNEMDDFHSQLTLDSQYIFLLSKHFEDRARDLSGDELLKLTSLIFKGEYNTISSAYSILALGAYSKLVLASDSSKPNKDQSEKNIQFYSKVEEAKKVLLQSMLTPFTKSQYSVETDQLSVKADDPLYYLNVQSGFDKNLPEESIREGIEIQRAFLDGQGNQLTSFEQGKEITVRLRVRALNDQKLTNIAVIDLLPGGFEIIRSSVSRTAYNWKADYIDIREDRLVIYGDFDSSLRELTYKVKLTSAGKFVVPPSYAESMYDRSIRAVAKAGTFVVTPQEN